jgi:hypothetical protein
MITAQRSRLWILAAGVAIVAIVATLILANDVARSGPKINAPGANHYPVSAEQSADGPVAVGNGVRIGGAQRHDKTPSALRDMPAKPVRALPAEDEDEDGESDRPMPAAVDPVVQSAPAAPLIAGTIKNFEGIGFPGVACNCAPPDTNGEAGLTQYVQIVNEGYQVWNKSTGSSVFGPVGITTLWQGFGGVCETNGSGDPVVLYDQLANRWLVSQFAGVSVPTDECIAISTTGDATGSFYRYGFHLGSNFFDYPHLAVWPDAYYMSMNVFNSSGTLFLGPQAFAFDRTRMLAGLSATFVTPGITGGSTEDAFLPADVDGSTAPAAGAPATFVSYPGSGAYKTRHFHADFVTPANTTFTLFASPAAAGFTALCALTRSCVPQGATTARLDAIGDRLMFRLAYRNFGDHESVVGNYTVSSGGVAGIRWFELRNVTNGPVTKFQESTYQPDTTWRWMGSAAMDGAGGIALGFSASSASISPQIRYAGRLASDPLNTLGQGEATLFSGTGSQTGTSSRWGDYSDLTIDPSDDCTFWFTTEYYTVTTSFSWHTRVGSFQLPGCGGQPPTPGAIAGHVTDASNGAALVGATVTIQGGGSTLTDGTGAYTLGNLNAGSYTLTASKSGYTSSAPTQVSVTSGNTTTQDFALSPVPVTVTTPVAYATASAQGAGGDGNGYETNRANLLGSPDAVVASDGSSGSASSTSCTSTARDSEVTSGHAFGTLGSSILGIQVQLRGRVNVANKGPRFCVQLSWDGGTSWTTGKTTSNLTTSLANYPLGSTTDTWGHAWTALQLSSANFRVRVIDLANATSKTFFLDSVGVAVTHQ